jgi:hypothetical protein
VVRAAIPAIARHAAPTVSGVKRSVEVSVNEFVDSCR